MGNFALQERYEFINCQPGLTYNASERTEFQHFMIRYNRYSIGVITLHNDMVSRLPPDTESCMLQSIHTFTSRYAG